MHKKLTTKWIVVGCIAVAIAGTLIYLLLNRANNSSMKNTATTPDNSMASNSEANPAVLAFAQNGNGLDITIDSKSAIISGSQLAIAYDPTVITNVVVQQGTFFYQPTILQTSIDSTKGVINYTIAMSPGGLPAKGQGTLATITFDRIAGVQQSAIFSFLPQTMLTASETNHPVWIKTTGITLRQSLNNL